jgi:type VI secretion system VgrG family protein
MAFQERKRFTFVCQGLPEDTFSVVRFKGVEGISRLYEFDITLVSDDPEINLQKVLQNPATLTILGGGQDRPIHGILAQFEQLHEVKHHVFYRAFLVPRLWQASLYHENQLFLDKSVPNVIEDILKQAGLTTQDYVLKLTRNSYPQWEYVCQYRETDLDFISRWMEREGIYYYFEQEDKGEKLIITDSLTAHKDIAGQKTIPYSPPSALIPEEEAVVKALMCRQSVLPKKVILKDYNYRKPSLELKGEAQVNSKGRGDVYRYGEHFKTPDDGNALAKIRAEEILCRGDVFHGESTVPTLCPGFILELEGHYRESYNQRYLITELEHEGSQAGTFLAGIEEGLAEGEKELVYANTFTAIPADVQFRPERKTPKPRFYGTMNARVDAAGDGQFAELDNQGRYKVKLPFDQSGRDGGKASRWVRMAQPYTGPNYGVHFPLHKGAEVLLTFVDGDPDRPVITGSVPNPGTASPVTSANQTKSVIRDNYGNEIIFDATPGDEHILLYSPHHQSGLAIGKSVKSFSHEDQSEATFGNSAKLVLGFDLSAFVGWEAAAKLAASFGIKAGPSVDIDLGRTYTWSVRDVYRNLEEDYIIKTDKELSLSADQANKSSILYAGKQKLELSVGSQKHPIPEMLEDKWKLGLRVALASLAAVVGAGLAVAAVEGGQAMDSYTEPPEKDEALEDAGAQAFAGTFGALSVAVLLVLAIVTICKKPAVTNPEPVRHEDREADSKIALVPDGVAIKSGTSEIHVKKDGTINIIGKKSVLIQNSHPSGEIIFQPGGKAAFKLDNKQWKNLENYESKNLKVTNP